MTKDNKFPLISVIVPIYNVEKYLRQCVDSILAQTLTNIEVILVDDGSPDNCPQICDEYVAKDKRVKVIHKANGGLGAAYNTGIETAIGEYIGLVEPDDWIEPDMYEVLLNKALSFKADLVVGSWFYSSSSNNIPDKEIEKSSSAEKLFTIADYPSLLTIHPSVWAKLYHRRSLGKIRFPEFKGAGYCDGPFNTEVLCSMKKIITVHRPLYFYRTDNENASSNNLQNGKKLIGIIDCWDSAKNILKKYGKYDLLKEELYFLSSKSSLRFFCNIRKEYKKEFFVKFMDFVKELKDDKSFAYKYFEGTVLNKKRKKFIMTALKKDFASALDLIKFDKVKRISIMGLPIWKKTVSGNKKKTKFLGIPLVVKNQKHNEKRTKILNIFKVKQSELKTNYYFLGIKIFSKTNFQAMHRNMFNRLNQLESSVLNLKTNILASQIHPNIFKKYANKYEGNDIVIVACGPSAADYIPIKGAIHIGINRAFKRKDILFDYLFFNNALYPEGDSELRNYASDCVKFLGMLPDRFFFHPQVYRFKPNIFNLENVFPFILEYKLKNMWAYDIAYEPFADFGSTVFSALQFALYTNPRRVYLVGCDCSSGYFYDNQEVNVSKYSASLVDKWKTFKIIKDKYYSSTDVFSINPVGLKGLFKDLYINKGQSK